MNECKTPEHHESVRKPTSSVLPCVAGRRVPEGSAAVGWRVGVYWRDDQKFYMGEIAAYNEEDDEYEMNYDDSKPCSCFCTDATYH